MKSPALLLLLFSFCLSVPMQAQQKGATPIPQSIIRNPQSVRAVVIGISDYQDPAIPDLRFADKDAEAFANFLRSPAGGALDGDHLKLLLNEQATIGELYNALDWLVEASQAGDRAIIYFSGHGDIEVKTLRQEGFLLCYNSPPNNYRSNAFAVYWLRDIVEQLSTNKQAKVVLITDACRAGKLAGSSIGGAQATAAALQTQFANEIKILSCQPDEYSIEGEQWGGGRGAFSYHLVNALYGFADQNNDLLVSLQETRRYLEDHVTPEVAPQNQAPMVSGPNAEKMAVVVPEVLATAKTRKAAEPTTFSPGDMRGLEEDVLTRVDSNVRQVYAAFMAAIARKDLMRHTADAQASANEYYDMLVREPSLQPLHGHIKRTFVAALLDEGQTIINKVLKTDPQQLDNIWANRVQYDHLPAYYQRATEILGEQHYAYRDLKSKGYYFKAMTFRAENYPDSTIAWRQGQRKKLLEDAISFDSSFVLALREISSYVEPKQGLEYLYKTIELAPNWALAHYTLGSFFTSPFIEPEAAIVHYKKAMELNPAFLKPFNWIANSYELLGLPDSAQYYQRLFVDKYIAKFQQDSASITVFECNDIGNALWRLREPEKAKTYLLLGEKISKGKQSGIYANLAVVYADLFEFQKAIEALENMMRLNPRGFPDQPGSIYFYFLFDTEKAIESWAKRGEVASYNQLAAWYSMGNYEKTYRLARKNIGDSPLIPLPLAYYAAESAWMLGLNDTATFFYRELIKKYQEGRKFPYGGFMTPFTFAVIAHYRLGEMEAFDTLIKSAIQASPNNPWVYFKIARIYAQTGRDVAAIQSLEKAIELGWQPNLGISIDGTLCDPLLNPIRETDAFKALVRKYYPKYYDIATRVPGKP